MNPTALSVSVEARPSGSAFGLDQNPPVRCVRCVDDPFCAVGAFCSVRLALRPSARTDVRASMHATETSRADGRQPPGPLTSYLRSSTLRSCRHNESISSGLNLLAL